MTESNADIRANLLKYANLFMERNCQYSYEELAPVKDVLKLVKPPIESYEDFNSRHPQHGLSPKNKTTV